MKGKNFYLASSLTTALASTMLLSAAPSMALTYGWNIDFIAGAYKAQGIIYTNTNTPNQALVGSNITGWSINLSNNGVLGITITPSNTSTNYGSGLQVNSTSTAINLINAPGAFYSMTIRDGANSNSFYFGSPFSNGIANVRINIGGASSGFVQPGSGFVLATGGAEVVPWEISPATGALIGVPLFLGLRTLKKRKVTKASKIKVASAAS